MYKPIVKLFYPTAMKNFNENIFHNGIGEKYSDKFTQLYFSKLMATVVAESLNEDAVVVEIDAKSMIYDGYKVIDINEEYEGMCISKYVDPKYFVAQYNIHNNKKVEEI